MASSYMNRKTPGVYITEFPAFAPSVVGVATAIPVFIGYTETAKDPSSGKPAYNQAIAIGSLADFESYFGGAFDTKYYVHEVVSSVPAGSPAKASPAVGSPAKASPAVGSPSSGATLPYDFQALYSDVLSNEVHGGSPSGGSPSGGSPAHASPATGSPSVSTVPQLLNYEVTANSPDISGSDPTQVARFNLHTAVQLFYNNGGGNCFVVSVGNYAGKQEVTGSASDTPIQLSSASSEALLNGLSVAQQTTGPTMVVVPDACLLKYQMTDLTTHTTTASGSPYSDVVSAMLTQSSAQKDRVAILDLPGAVDADTWNSTALATTRTAFYQAISPASDSFSYGAAYAPALEVSVLTSSDVNFTNLYGGAGSDGTYPSILLMNKLLTTQATQSYSGTKLTEVLGYVTTAYPPDGQPASWTGTQSQINNQITTTNNYLMNALPLLGQIQQIMLDKLNVAPPSGAMAGIWTRNDANKGVWNAPANVALTSVVTPKVILNDLDQEDYNVPLNGQSIGLLRSFPNRGTVVWGARTLDGNSNDYRYIQVRRTLVYIEQSIKAAIQPFVFAPNVGQTWTTVTCMISNFLTGVWSQGGLMGDKASDAFSVQCGLGTTMTAQNILNGYMIVSVTLQMVHPAEYIELTFTQTMQGS